MFPVKALADEVATLAPVSSKDLVVEEDEVVEEAGVLSSRTDTTEEKGESIDQMAFQLLPLDG